VRAQVDHDLTTVSCFDRLLGLIKKNLGRHKKQRSCWMFQALVGSLLSSLASLHVPGLSTFIMT
jgi:hypothetical protein